MRGLLVAILILVAGPGCSKDQNPVAGEAGPRLATDGSPSKGDWFVDRAAETGLDFVHFNGMSGQFYDAEIFPPGVALLDYDNDGDLDVYLVQGQMLGKGKGSPLKDRLYRNDLVVNADGTRTLHFTDVTEESRINVQSYGMGVAVGDYNNDGCPDIYRTGLGGSVMLRNNCDGTFKNETKETRTENHDRWSVSASFLDFDRDGWLDLYVGNYLRYSVDNDVKCASLAGRPDYCPPASYPPDADRLYRNNGNGTFTDVTATALLGGQHGPALGVVAADFNGDGWVDIYVANDGQQNLLWMNQRNGTFKNTALLGGAALASNGQATASMGVDAGDFDNDADEDVFHANQAGEGHTLLVNDGTGSFDDRTRESGLAPTSLPFTGFGAAWIDVDNDGWLDLLTVNGAVRVIEALARKKDPFPFYQHPQLFRNLRNGRFEEVTDQAGSVFRRLMVGRGAAFGDIDNDGDIDVLVGNNNGKTQLLVNNIGNRNHWVGLRLVGSVARPLQGREGGAESPALQSRTPPARDMLGARVGVVQADGRTYWRRARSDGSYASANDPRVVVGLGRLGDPVRVRVMWPDSRSEEWPQVAIDRYTTLIEGGGR